MLIALESTGGPFPRARVAQLAEQGTLNPKVQGSIPCASTNMSVVVAQPRPNRWNRSAQSTASDWGVLLEPHDLVQRGEMSDERRGRARRARLRFRQPS